MSSSVIRGMARIIVIWFLLFSIENLIPALLGAHAEYRWGDWGRGQLVGVPFAIALLLPLAFLLVVVARQIAARRSVLVSTLCALVTAWLAYALTAGPHVAALERRIPLVAGATIIAFATTFVAVRKMPLHRPRLLAVLGGCLAVAAWLADQRVLPGLYPPLHFALAAVVLAASACISLVFQGWPRAQGSGRLVRVGAVLAAAWMILSFFTVERDERVRHVLVRDTPVLGKLVRLSNHLPFGASSWDLDVEAGELDPELDRLIGAHDTPRTLDWSGCDVLLVTIDTLRADHLGSYGYTRPTSPVMDKLAARGARFEHAYSAAPITSYSSASLLAGRNMRSLLVNGAGNSLETWPEYMQELGYQTVALYPSALFAVDAYHFNGLRAKGFGFKHPIERNAKLPELQAELTTQIANASADKPMFIWVHVLEPHPPYEKHPGHIFPGGRPVDAYDSEIAATDEFVGKAVSLVESRSRCTVIMVTGDHGESFGEHGTKYHGTSVYEEQMRVPLIIVGPGVVPSVIEKPVQTFDLMPTTLAALGRPRSSQIIGRDLGGELSGSNVGDDYPGLAYAEIPRYRLVAVGSERLICDREASTCVLYDLTTDPGQLSPRWDRPERLRFLRKLAHALEVISGARFPLRFAVTSTQLSRSESELVGNTLVATGKPGTVVYGPYIELPAGTYELRWVGRGIDSPGQLAFNVTANFGREVLGGVTLNAKDLPTQRGELVRIPFVLDAHRAAVEFVVGSGGGGRVVLEELVVERKPDTP